MHIEPGVVEGSKMTLSYATAAGSAGLALAMALKTIRDDGGLIALALRSVFTTGFVLIFFQVLPHYPVGVSEVHFIFGATLYLVFGAGPTALGLAAGLFLQGYIFEPSDLPQYFINVTSLIVPLWLVTLVAKRLIARNTPYVGLKSWQVLAMSGSFQGSIIVCVILWSVYGQGFGAENMAAIGAFATSYLLVIIVEPIVALIILAIAKKLDPSIRNPIFYNRLHHPVV
ncbi:MAG: energy-coupling factor ABC transporter permease [Pseudomonadota bacterium]